MFKLSVKMSESEREMSHLLSVYGPWKYRSGSIIARQKWGVLYLPPSELYADMESEGYSWDADLKRWVDENGEIIPVSAPVKHNAPSE